MADESQQQGVTVRAAAAALGVSEAAILKRIRRKTLPAEKDQGGQWRVILPSDSIPDGTGQRTGHVPDAPDILPDSVPDKPDAVPDADQHAPLPLPAAIVARMAALEAENTLLREQLSRWQQEAETLSRLLDQQQRLSLADRAKDTPALVDASDQAPAGKRRFFFWRW